MVVLYLYSDLIILNSFFSVRLYCTAQHNTCYDNYSVNLSVCLFVTCTHGLFQQTFFQSLSKICIAPHREKLTSEALGYGSNSFYTANTPYLSSPRKRSPDGATTD